MKDAPASGVMKCTVHEVFTKKKSTEEIPGWATKLPFRRLKAQELPAGYVDGWAIDSVVIHSDLAMQYLLKQFQSMGGQVHIREISHFRDALQQYDIVINAAGLGAQRLCPDDRDLHPIRGQVVRIEQNGWKTAFIDDESKLAPFYVIPRQTDIIVGGTAQHNDYNLNVSAADTESILSRLKTILPSFGAVKVLEAKVGLRPGRKEMRVESELFENGKKLVVHEYGMGGSGWSVCFGAGMEVVDLLFAHLEKTKSKL